VGAGVQERPFLTLSHSPTKPLAKGNELKTYKLLIAIDVVMLTATVLATTLDLLSGQWLWAVVMAILVGYWYHALKRDLEKLSAAKRQPQPDIEQLLQKWEQEYKNDVS